MSEQYVPALGQIIPPDEVAHRDAVHVAVVPLVAACMLSPGHHFRLTPDNQAVHCYPDTLGAVGVVDPFLRAPLVLVGQRFWGFIYPGTVTSLRHAWSHPAFVVQAPVPSQEVPTAEPVPRQSVADFRAMKSRIEELEDRLAKAQSEREDTQIALEQIRIDADKDKDRLKEELANVKLELEDTKGELGEARCGC